MNNRTWVLDVLTFRGIKGFIPNKKITNQQIEDVFKQLCDDMITQDEAMNEKFYNNIPLKVKKDIIASIDNRERIIVYFLYHELIVED